jgi:putative flippase GtrA
MIPANPPDAPAAQPPHSLTRHGAGFLASGLIALAADTGITSLLTRWAGLSAFAARPIAIAMAMVVAWACHRRLTFAMTVPPTLMEFARYAAVGWSAAAVNYSVYALVLIVAPSTPPEVALVMSSLVSMVVSYVGMKFGVFTRRAT